jgi:hypothetical protein
MASTATATGFLELNIAGFDKAISTAKKALVGLAGAFAAFKTVQFWKEGIEGAIKFGDEVFHASQRIGAMDPGKLLIAQKALENAGLGAEEARGQINQLVEAGRPLSTLFKGSDDYAKALQNATASYGSQANILSTSAEKLSKVFEIIQSVGSKLQTFFLAMTAKFTVPLLALLRMLDEIDLAGMGAKFGDNISKAAALLIGLYKNSEIGKTLGLALKVGFMDAYNWLVNALASLIEKLQQFKFNSKIFDNIVLIFKGIAELIGATLKSSIATALNGITVAGIPLMSDERKSQLSAESALSARLGNKLIGKGASGLERESGLVGGIGGFIKGLTTPTEEARKELAQLTAAAQKTGEEFLKVGAGDQSKVKIMTEGLGSQDPYKVIASSMAKVGGGGGYMVQGMTIEARNQIKMIRQQEFTNELIKAQTKAIEKQGQDKMKK